MIFTVPRSKLAKKILSNPVDSLKLSKMIFLYRRKSKFSFETESGEKYVISRTRFNI